MQTMSPRPKREVAEAETEMSWKKRQVQSAGGTQPAVAGREDGGRSLRPKAAVVRALRRKPAKRWGHQLCDLKKLNSAHSKEQRNRSSPWLPASKGLLPIPWFEPNETRVRLLTYGTGVALSC